VDRQGRAPLPRVPPRSEPPLLPEEGRDITLVPLDSHLVRGVEGKAPPLNVRCAKPTCHQFSAERHHLWSRSWLRGQPYEWVLLPSGETIANSVGLCTIHHGDVTGDVGGHRAKIVLDDDELVWYDRGVEGWTVLGTLFRAEEHDSDRCPTCGHITQEAKPLPKRRVKTWHVTVPDDDEYGAGVLDSYVEDFAGIFGFSDKSARLRRYHVLARVLQWASMNRIDLIKEWEEAEA
jgi:hypothetical protein